MRAGARRIRAALPVVLVVLALGALATSGTYLVADSPGSADDLARPGRPLLIKHGWDTPTSEFVAANVATMEQRGFDGVVVGLGDLWDRVQSTTPVSYERLRDELAPLAGIPFTTMTHNFVITYSASAPGYFDDYSVPLDNYRNLARAAREVGLEGIVIDTEDYYDTVQDWPGATPGRGVDEARQQAALRGREVAEAILAGWPDATTIVLGGPWLGEPGTAQRFAGRIPYIDYAPTNELRGSFFIGMVEGTAGTGGAIVDGGGLYSLRTPAQFEFAYEWLKTGLPQYGEHVPDDLRARYPSVVGVAFGVFDRPFGGAPMNARVWGTTLANALCRTDRYVWAYTERYDWWGLGWPAQPVPQEWVAATAAGEAAGLRCRSGG